MNGISESRIPKIAYFGVEINIVPRREYAGKL